eukprot:s2421_g7.t1
MEQDVWSTSWNILDDEHFERARVWVRSAHHTHMAPPCKSFTRARRSDKHGKVEVIRSPEKPTGWGHPMAEEGNKVAERVAILLDEAESSGGTASVENPDDSFIWEQLTLERHVKKHPKVSLDQCAYGAETRKPTGILTSARWPDRKDHRLHQRTPRIVWKTSLAAEYPTGLCWAWAKALLAHLGTAAGSSEVNQKTFVKNGNKLQVKEPKVKQSIPASGKEKRDQENEAAVGGLRNPYRAILHSSSAWKLGAAVRQVLLSVLRQCPEDLKQLSGASFTGFSEATVLKAADALGKLVGIGQPEQPTPLRVELLGALLSASGDPERHVQDWLRTGFPLGIDKPLETNTVFPETTEDTKAVEMSKMYPLLTGWEEADQAVNYKSFQEAGQDAVQELHRVAELGYATRCTSWQEVVAYTGNGASLTKLGCIQKTRLDVSTKTRLVVDCRRSGVNGLMVIRQRVVLPRVSDVAVDWKALQQQGEPIEIAVVDFCDAFYQCRLAPQERKHVVVKAHGTTYFVLEVVAFGLACGPLLWSRLAAALVRLAQAVGWDTLRIQCYVDDPLLLVQGPCHITRSVNLALPLLLWQALGCKMSWAKLQRGLQVEWIGFQLALEDNCLVAQLSPAKLQKLADALDSLLDCKGVIPVAQLRSTAGMLGWLTSIVRLARPWVGMLWGCIAECEARVVKQARVRKNLVFVKQVRHALYTLLGAGSFRATFHWETRPLWRIQTDASVYGFGGILWKNETPIAWWADIIQPADLALLEACTGDPAWQSEWELLAVAISLHLFGPALQGQAVFLSTDNTGVLHAGLQLRASSPGMVKVAAELACVLRQFDIEMCHGSHLRSAANYLADALSRLSQGAAVPARLVPVLRLTAGPRDAWSPAGGFQRGRGSADLAAVGIRPCGPRGFCLQANRVCLFARGGKPRQERGESVKTWSPQGSKKGNKRLGLPREGEDPWSLFAKRPCQLCSRKPVVLLCSRCGVETCGACISRQAVAPYRWQCLDYSCSSDESGEQARLLVSCQNEEIACRTTVLPQPDPEESEGLAGALAKRLLGDQGRHPEMAWWAEVKRKDWELVGDRPAMPFSVMKAYTSAASPAEADDEGAKLPSAGSADPAPHAADMPKPAVKEEPLEEEPAGKRRKTGALEGVACPTTPAGNPSVRSGGPVVLPPKTRARGSTSKALLVAASEELMKKARQSYGELVYAKSTAAAKESKAKLFVQIAEARNMQPLPLSPQLIAEVAAVLRAADFSSGATYLAEAKQLHIRSGHTWDEALDLALQDAERALSRAIGPAVKAEEVVPKLWRVWAKAGLPGFERKQMQPEAGPEIWCMGSAFMLREVELGHLLMGSVQLDLQQRTATLSLSLSKTDPGGKGAKRTRACTCGCPADDEGELDCPFHSTLVVVGERAKQLRQRGWSEEEMKEFTVVGQVGCPTLIVSKEAMVAALKQDAAAAVDAVRQGLKCDTKLPDVNRVTGHTLRRSGAKDAVKRFKYPLAMVQWLGRWGSSAVQGYVEEALEEMPENNVLMTTWEGIAQKTVDQLAKHDQLEGVVTALREEMATDLASTKAMVVELKERACPKMVMNVSTMVLHATAKAESAEWRDNPMNWVTRCGGWRWAAAGRLARPITASEHVGEALALCSKCRPCLIEEKLITHGMPFSW